MTTDAVLSPANGRQLETAAPVPIGAVAATLGLIASALITIGLMEGGSGALWPDVIDAFGVSKGVFGFAGGVGLTIALPVFVFGGRITAAFDKRAMLAFAGAVLAITLVGFTLGSGAAVMVGLFAFRGLGLCVLELGANALAMEIEQQTRRHLMSPLHAGFSGGAVTGAGIAWTVFALGGGFRIALLILSGLFAALFTYALWQWRLHRAPATRATSDGPGLSIGLYRRADVRAYALLTGVAFCGEMLIAQWIGIYLRDERGYAESSGAVAVILLSAAMFAGRLLNGPATVKAGARRALMIQGGLMVVGAVGIVSLNGVVPIAIACGIAGLGLAGVGPTALSLAGKAVPESSGAASGAALIGGYVGLAITPFIAGFVASVASVRTVLFAELLFAALVLGVAVWMGRVAIPPATQPGMR